MSLKRPLLVLIIYLVSSLVFLMLAASQPDFRYKWIFIGIYILLIGCYIYLEIKGARKLSDQVEADKRTLEVLFDLSLDGIFIENDRGDILDCNRSGHEMFGFTKEEMLSKSIRDLVPEEFALSLPEIIPDEMATGDKYVERINRKKDNTLFPTEINTQYIYLGGEKRLIVYIRDITERKKMEEKLMLLSIRDELTGVFNRRYMLAYLKHMLERLKRDKRDTFSVAILDLDCFKEINDEHGHIFGDEVLRNFAHTLDTISRAIDIVGRYGGDEFLIIFPRSSCSDSKVIIKRFENAVHSLTLSRQVNIFFSAGIVEITQDNMKENNVEDILQMADVHMYQAKKRESGMAVSN